MLQLINNIKLATNVISLFGEIKAIFDDNKKEFDETKDIIKRIIDDFKELGEKVPVAKHIYFALAKLINK